jgi:hypothetical protein
LKVYYFPLSNSVKWENFITWNSLS